MDWMVVSVEFGTWSAEFCHWTLLGWSQVWVLAWFELVHRPDALKLLFPFLTYLMLWMRFDGTPLQLQLKIHAFGREVLVEPLLFLNHVLLIQIQVLQALDFLQQLLYFILCVTLVLVLDKFSWLVVLKPFEGWVVVRLVVGLRRYGALLQQQVVLQFERQAAVSVSSKRLVFSF